MKIYIAADHQGFHLREGLIKHLKGAGHDVVDAGDTKLDPNDDFPVFAHKAATEMLGSDDPDARAILICGGGQGMCMMANRIKGIRASMIWDEQEARITRKENDSNVLCLPARLLKDEEAYKIVDTWLNTPFAGAARYIRRNKQLDEL